MSKGGSSMAVGLAPEQLELAAAVRGWSQRHCPAEVLRSAVDGSDSGAVHYRAELAPSLAGQGLFGLHLPEAAGGQGFGLPELAVALEETGRALLPGAFLPTVLASAVLAESVLAEPVLAEPVLAEPAGAAGAAGPAGADSGLSQLLARLGDRSPSGPGSLAAGPAGGL